MSAQQFGGRWTEQKLQILKEYLTQYLLIFTRSPRAKHLTPHYVDAFAGSGLREDRGRIDTPLLPDFDDAVRVMDGSPRMVLSLDGSFHNYWFVEKSSRQARELRSMIDRDFPERAPLCQVRPEDANTFLKSWCQQLGGRDRAVVFLDPFAMSCEWDTVASLGQTQKVDLWVLFPVSAVIRNLPHAGPRDEWKPALSGLFGTDEWEQYFYTPEPTPDFFETEQRPHRDVTVERIVQFYTQQLKTVFADVTERPKILYNRQNSALFFLAFAAANRQGAGPALRIANHLTERSDER